MESTWGYVVRNAPEYDVAVVYYLHCSTFHTWALFRKLRPLAGTAHFSDIEGPDIDDSPSAITQRHLWCFLDPYRSVIASELSELLRSPNFTSARAYFTNDFDDTGHQRASA